MAEDGFSTTLFGDDAWNPDVGAWDLGTDIGFGDPDLGTVETMVGSVYNDGDAGGYYTPGGGSMSDGGSPNDYVYASGGAGGDDWIASQMGMTPDEYYASQFGAGGATDIPDAYAEYASGGGSQTDMGTPIDLAGSGTPAGGNFGSVAAGSASLFQQIAAAINKGSQAVTGKNLLGSNGTLLGGTGTPQTAAQVAAQKQTQMLMIGALVVGGFLLLRRR